METIGQLLFIAFLCLGIARWFNTMPSRPKRPCLISGCPELADNGYCATHQQRTAQKQYDKYRGSSASRGYDYKWIQWRKQVLSEPEFVICKQCQLEGDFKIASELHHPKKVRDYPELQYNRSNVVPLCKPHHSALTVQGR